MVMLYYLVTCMCCLHMHVSYPLGFSGMVLYVHCWDQGSCGPMTSPKMVKLYMSVLLSRFRHEFVQGFVLGCPEGTDAAALLLSSIFYLDLAVCPCMSIDWL